MNHPALSDRDVLAVTLYGEARGEPREGKLAVANVIRNRLHSGKYGTSISQVCWAPYQFSCWIPQGGTQNWALVNEVAEGLARGNEDARQKLRECLAIADAVLHDEEADNTNGADHYLTTGLYQSPAAPKWARTMRVTATIGRHTFLASA